MDVGDSRVFHQATLVEDSHVSAIAAGLILDWDSRLFGFTAARLDLSTGEPLQAVLSAFLEKCREWGGAEEVDAIHTLARNEFELLDGVQTPIRCCPPNKRTGSTRSGCATVAGALPRTLFSSP